MSEEKKFYFLDWDASKSHKLSDNLIIGRSSDADITLEDEKVSGSHLKVNIIDGELYVWDLGTSNGTELNGINLAPKKKTKLIEGDKVKIGRKTLMLSNERLSQAKKKGLHLIPGEGKFREFEAFTGKLDLEIDIEGDSVAIQADVENGANPEKEIRRHQFKIKAVQRELEKIQIKIGQKEDLNKKLITMNKENEALLKEAPALKTVYEENKEDWDHINLKIKKLERELKKFKDKKNNHSGAMGKYDQYLAVSKKRSELILEIKEYNREDLQGQIDDARYRIEDREEKISNIKRKMVRMELEKEKEKEREKERIRDEIKKLEDKLSNVK